MYEKVGSVGDRSEAGSSTRRGRPGPVRFRIPDVPWEYLHDARHGSVLCSVCQKAEQVLYVKKRENATGR